MYDDFKFLFTYVYQIFIIKFLKPTNFRSHLVQAKSKPWYKSV